jgi:hypothetical protein
MEEWLDGGMVGWYLYMRNIVVDISLYVWEIYEPFAKVT